MTTKIINGKQIADKIADKLKKEVAKLNNKPSLAIVIYKPDERSKVYVKLKQSRAQEIGIKVKIYDWSDCSQDKCLKSMQELASSKEVDGIIVQLPLNGWYDPQVLLDLIPAHKDVDGLSNKSLENLKNNNAQLVPATPKAVLLALEHEKVELDNKKIVIVGQGKLVGLPLAIILKSSNYDVITADINTKDIQSICKKADVLISATGVSKIIKGDMVKAGAIMIDAGIVEINGKLTGDVDYSSVESKCSIIAKVPGGIGPITVVSLLQNVVMACASK